MKLGIMLNKQHEFNKHNSVVQCVIYNDTNDTYLSLDDRGVPCAGFRQCTRVALLIRGGDL